MVQGFETTAQQHRSVAIPSTSARANGSFQEGHIHSHQLEYHKSSEVQVQLVDFNQNLDMITLVLDQIPEALVFYLFHLDLQRYHISWIDLSCSAVSLDTQAPQFRPS